MRTHFDEQLSQLNADLIDMGTMIEYAIESSASALISMDGALANRIVRFDHEVDRKERDIESLCLKLILHQQPIAKDLRFISAALKMITDMERIGDQAADIAEIVTMMLNDDPPRITDHFSEMARVTTRMVRQSIDAFVSRDMLLARQVVNTDDVVDGLFDDVRGELIDLLARNPDRGRQALDLLMIAKYFERIGDHATNIAEWVEFAITGIHKEENS
ncbi:MAG: phosphate signaling complex protein PhoU [Candidatus Faecivicinus sp.]